MEKTEHKTLRFKTNIKCGGCIAQVSPALNEAEGISHWEVDTADKNLILTVKSEGISQDDIVKVVRKAGYTIDPL